MNEMTRNIDVVTGEIIVLQENAKRIFFQTAIEIGRRLEEAKTMVAQGEWTNYLTNVLKFKPSTAQNYMKIARELGDGQIGFDGTSKDEVFGELSYSQLLPLLGLPEDERKELAAQNDLAEMSTRQIEQLTRDYKAAKAAQETAQRKSDELQDELDKLQKQEDKKASAEENERAARVAAEAKARDLEGRVTALLEQLKEQPIEATASIVPDEETIERERERVREELRAQIADAETRAREAAEKLEQAKNPVAAQVNFLFVEISGLCQRMSESYGTLENTQEETAGKFGEAIKRFFEGQAVRYGG